MKYHFRFDSYKIDPKQHFEVAHSAHQPSAITSNEDEFKTLKKLEYERRKP